MSIPDCMYDYRQENISREPDVIGNCSYCSDEVTEGDCRYELDDDVILHEDCLTNYMHKYYKE